MLSVSKNVNCKHIIIIRSIITQVIIKIRAPSSVENGVIFRDIYLTLIFKIAASRFVDASEEQVNIMKEYPIPRNTKDAKKFTCVHYTLSICTSKSKQPIKFSQHFI